MYKLLTLFGVIFASFVSSIGALYMKKASQKFEIKKLISSFPSKNLIVGITLYFLSALIIIFLLMFNDISFLYPLTALTYVFVILMSWKILNEKINAYKITAVILIISGAVLIMTT